MTTVFLSLFSVPAPVCPSVPMSSNGVIIVRWSYTHTGGLELTQVIVTATKGNLAAELDVPNGNLTDLYQTYLNIDTFTAGFSYTFTVTAYNQLGSSSVQCDPVTHRIGTCQNSLYLHLQISLIFGHEFNCITSTRSLVKTYPTLFMIIIKGL